MSSLRSSQTPNGHVLEQWIEPDQQATSVLCSSDTPVTNHELGGTGGGGSIFFMCAMMVPKVGE